MMENSKNVAAIVAAKKLCPDLQCLYLFGSHATGTARTDSDVDFAVLKTTPLAADVAFELKTDLSIVCKRDVDLVDLFCCDTVTAAQVVTFGVLLHTNSAFVSDSFEMVVLSKYALLNEDRKELLEDILSRGSVYGR